MFDGHEAIHREVDSNDVEEDEDEKGEAPYPEIGFLISKADVDELLEDLVLIGFTNENHDAAEHSDHEVLEDDLGPVDVLDLGDVDPYFVIGFWDSVVDLHDSDFAYILPTQLKADLGNDDDDNDDFPFLLSDVVLDGNEPSFDNSNEHVEPFDRELGRLHDVLANVLEFGHNVVDDVEVMRVHVVERVLGVVVDDVFVGILTSDDEHDAHVKDDVVRKEQMVDRLAEDIIEDVGVDDVLLDADVADNVEEDDNGNDKRCLLVISDACESGSHDGGDEDVIDEESCLPKPQTLLCYHVEI